LAPVQTARGILKKDEQCLKLPSSKDILRELNKAIQEGTITSEMMRSEFASFQNIEPDTKGNIREVIEKVLEALDSDFNLKQKKIEVSIQEESELPEIQMSQPNLYLAFMNLLKNACEAMPEGGKLDIKIGKGGQNARGTSESIVVQISDTGVGMTKEQQKNIFQPFFSTKQRGFGVGLVNVKQIIEGHKGKIKFESKLGKGTTFVVTIPNLKESADE
jgi:signal transduction histidine kinase